MTTFTATFANGQTITRNSDHAYAFAWAVIRNADGKIEESGFSADRANAEKAAQSKRWSGISARDRKSASIRAYHAKIAKDRGLANLAAFYADAEARAAAHNAARRIEIVQI